MALLDERKLYPLILTIPAPPELIALDRRISGWPEKRPLATCAVRVSGTRLCAVAANLIALLVGTRMRILTIGLGGRVRLVRVLNAGYEVGVFPRAGARQQAYEHKSFHRRPPISRD